MNMIIFKKYLNSLTIKDIDKYAKNNNINFNDEELDIVYFYIKNKYQLFFDNPLIFLENLKLKLTPINYRKINALYENNKEKIRNYLT